MILFFTFTLPLDALADEQLKDVQHVDSLDVTTNNSAEKCQEEEDLGGDTKI